MDSDLSTSALWSHINHWGGKGKLLSVRCDASKPLEANIKTFRGDENDPGIRRARENHNPERFGWRLLEPIAFIDSRDHPATEGAHRPAGQPGGRVGAQQGALPRYSPGPRIFFSNRGWTGLSNSKVYVV